MIFLKIKTNDNQRLFVCADWLTVVGQSRRKWMSSLGEKAKFMTARRGLKGTHVKEGFCGTILEEKVEWLCRITNP